MFWISAGSLILIFYSCRSYLNNATKWRERRFPQGFSRIYFVFLQTGNILITIAGVSFLMLAIVSHVNGYEINFSSEYAYHIQLLTE